MGSPVTLTGFNSIDFGMILDAVMQQESAPLTSLQTQQRALQSRATTYGTLATKLSTFDSALAALSTASTLFGRSTANSDETAVRAQATAAAAPGTYDIVVQELARAQVTASVSASPDPDTTVVATGGMLMIGGVTVTIDTPVTLQELAAKINATPDIGVTASVIKSGPAAWQLVLTGRNSGTAGAFTVANGMTGGAGVAFTDTNGDGVAGDSPADNAVVATDARALVNNIQVVSSTNTLDDVVAGVSLTLLKKDPAATATVTVSEDVSGTKAAMQKVVDAYNDILKFVREQDAAAGKGDASSVARDPLLRSLRFALRSAFTADYAAGGAHQSLATIGLGLERDGRMSFDDKAFDSALAGQRAEVVALLTGDGVNQGAIVAVGDLIKSYTKSDGLLRDTRSRLDDQVSALTQRINDLTDRLARRRATLQREYISADTTMTQLKNGAGALSSLANQYRLF